MHDRYRDWERRGSRVVRLGIKTICIEDQVLLDLATTEDELEKLEILDSFGAHAMRHYRQRLIDFAVQKAVELTAKSLGSWIQDMFPQVEVRTRPRAGTEERRNEQ